MPDAHATAARRQTPRRIVLGLVALAAVVLLAATALTRLDADFLRARMEAAAYHATGRRLVIAGPVHLIVFPSPGFVADDVTLANLAGGSRPAMAHADAVQATLDLGALLGRRVVVRSLVLTNPDILLERTADGQPNWVFTPTAEPPSPPRPPGAPPAPARPEPAHAALTISSLEIDGGRLAWRNLPRLGAGDFAIRHLDAQQQRETSSFTLSLAGQHAATPFALSLASGPPQALLAEQPAHPFPLRGSLALGARDGDDEAPDQLTVDGQFADPLHGRGFAGVVHARLRALGDLDGLFPRAELPAAAGVRLEARLAQGADGSWTVSALHAGTGAADAGRLLPGLALAHLTVDAANGAAPVVLHAAGRLRGQVFALDAPAFGSLAAWNGAAPGPLDAAASLGGARARLRGTIGRSSDGSAALDAASSLDLPDPGALAAAFGRTLDRHDAVAAVGHLVAARTGGAVTASLDATSWQIDASAMPASRFELDRQPGAELHIALALTGAAPWLVWRESVGHEPADITVVLAGHRVPATLVAALAGAGHGLGGPLDVAGQLTGLAPDGRIDLADLDGTLSATLVDGTISGALLAPALRATHLAPGVSGAERVRCAGFTGQVAHGVVALSSLSLDSRLLAIDGSGTVNLPTGALDLHLRPVVRMGVAAASAPVVIGGTIAAPVASLAHDEQGRVALSFGGAAPASVACDANPDVAALPPPKAPRAVDILRGLGLFR